MKKLLPTLLGAWVAAVWAIVPASSQTIPVSPKVAAPAAPSADAVAPYIQSIQQATDPSALITAYANGFAVDRTSLKLHVAYITRMIDFGMPELAYHQAELAATLDPRNGLVRGVLAYVNARRGLMAEALSEIVQAASLSPDSPFVQRTAGELLAWYDRNFLDLKIDDATKVALDNTRRALSSRAPFAQAYDDARKALADQAAAADKATSAGPYVAPAATSQPSAGNTPATNPTYADLPPDAYVYSTGGNTYSYAPADDYPPLYDPGYYSGPPPWWWSSGVFFGGPFFACVDHHRHHDHDFDGHHRQGLGEGGGSWDGRTGRLFGTRLSPQQQLHAAVASVKPVGTGGPGPGAGTSLATSFTGASASGHEGAFRAQAARGVGAGGILPGGTVFLAVNGRVVARAHGDGPGAKAFTSGNLEPAPLRAAGSTMNVSNSTAMVSKDAPNLSNTTARIANSGSQGSSFFSVAGGTSSSSSHEAHVTRVMPSGTSGGGGHSGGGGGARFTALSGGRVSFSGGGFSGGGGGSFAGRSGGSFSSGGFSRGFTGGFGGGGQFRGGGHAGGGHR